VGYFEIGSRMTRDELCQTALNLQRDGLRYDDIIPKLRMHYAGNLDDPTRGWVARLIADAKCKRAGKPHPPETNAGAVSVSDPDFVGADTQRLLLRQYLDTTWEARKVYVRSPHKTRVVVGVGDFHGKPDSLVTAALIESQADVYVIGGDTTDQQYAARHPSETKAEVMAKERLTYRNEMAEMRAWFEVMQDETSAEFHVLLGNHDQWSLKRAEQVLPAFYLEHFPEPLDILLKDFDPDRVKRVAVQIVVSHSGGTQTDIGKCNEFIYTYGDVLFSHLNKTQSMTESGVSKVFRMWFERWDRTLGLTHIRMICHFHVHARTLKTAKGGHLLLVEPGMGGCVSTESYKHSYQGKWSPSVQGFVRLTQYCFGGEWQTDLDSVELVAPRMAFAPIA